MGSMPTQSVLRGEERPEAGRSAPLHRLMEAGLPGAANLPAVLEEGGGGNTASTTHAELHRDAARLARAMVRRAGGGTAPGDRLVAVCMEPGRELLVALLAAWKSGAAYLPLDPGFPAARVRHILGEASPALLVADTVDARLYEGLVDAVSYEELRQEAAHLPGEPLVQEEMLGQGSIALVLYTSGSTGVPKGVRLSHRAVLNRLAWQWRVFPYGSEERTCVFKTALTFVDSVCELWGPLLCGRAVLVVPREVTRDPERLVRLLEDHQVERLVLVPSLLRAVLLCLELDPRRGGGRLARLRTWVCSGEPLAPELASRFFRAFPGGRHRLCNFYGSTEVMGDVTYHVMESSRDVAIAGKVPIGRPLDNTAVYLLDSQMQPVVAGEAGELYVAGLNLADGYVNNRDPDRFVSNPLSTDPDYSRLYRTGDFARLVKGTLLYEGRTDSQVKVRGHRVDLSEVERAVLSLAPVQKGIALCYKPGEINQALVAFVTVEDGTVTDHDLEDMLSTRLASYMMPQIVIVEKIPLLVNGKIDRQTLLKDYETAHENGVNNNSTIEADYSGVPGKKMAAAQVLFETVGSVLGSSVRSGIRLGASFYELGGNSLNSVYTVTRLREQGYVIGISEFISSATLGEVLDRMLPEDSIECHAGVNPSESRFSAQALRDSHRLNVTRMITTSFYEKADLERWLTPGVAVRDYAELVDALWEPLLQKQLSFVVETEDGRPVGVALNFDAHDEPAVELKSKLTIVFDFLEHLEGPIREKRLPRGKGQVLHSFMLATDAALSAQENVAVVQFMEQEVLSLARRRGFAGVFTTNTNPLTQQLGTDVYGYQTLLEYQVNAYAAPDGSRPFAAAPDEQKVVVSWRRS
ncbi:beta-alanyl-bioamine nonribosomal peptide synthetase ebony [Bacillus rossius redtenbacheri]|uniref:beta-alanyl-bioamine nonribosomal peptide synthetase ebony n=1 Tax=Bacillus rossius redtenbacheri TaxID=93214 RepID=UPI002FDF00D5